MVPSFPCSTTTFTFKYLCKQSCANIMSVTLTPLSGQCRVCPPALLDASGTCFTFGLLAAVMVCPPALLDASGTCFAFGLLAAVMVERHSSR